MKNENYITIQGWMRNELKLKGNELLVYALIYGFSQDDDSEFTGSVRYISEWTGATKQTVHNTLKSLHEKELLHKEESFIKGVKYCSYRAILPPVKKFDGGSQKNLPGVVKNLDRGGQKILPNNIDDNIDEKIKCIVDFLNKELGTKYRSSTETTRSAIKARLNEGFTVMDFYDVITKKRKQWKGTKMEQFLRPQTLFGTKFESYLNQTIVKEEQSEQQQPKPKAYKEFEPEPEINAVPMPEEVRRKADALGIKIG